jgi:hypothetical protein
MSKKTPPTALRFIADSLPIANNAACTHIRATREWQKPPRRWSKCAQARYDSF